MAHSNHLRKLLVLLAAGLAQAASAGAAPPPKPGGVYPLMRGIYVATDTPCETAPNAAIRLYDGHGISTAHTHGCRVEVRARKGKTYQVRQTCIDAGAGPGPRFTQQQTVTMRSARGFTQTVRGYAASYRYCPVERLPPGLQPYAH